MAFLSEFDLRLDCLAGAAEALQPDPADCWPLLSVLPLGASCCLLACLRLLPASAAD